jgi:hypothetical protein
MIEEVTLPVIIILSMDLFLEAIIPDHSPALSRDVAANAIIIDSRCIYPSPVNILRGTEPDS